MRRSISERIRIEGPAGALEAIVEDVGAHAGAVAVVCHPHPLYGGTMDNKVVVSVARALHEAGVSTVRFNFRGVGASAGAYDEGRGELEDAIAVASQAATRWPGLPFISAGFSFGSYIALRLALSRTTQRLFTVAPAVSRFDFDELSRPACPWVIVQGEADEVVPTPEVVAWAGRLDPPAKLHLVPGAGHFFHGKLLALRDIVLAEMRGEG
ncbi:MAG: alpha/beta family hydrolase [Steroidobacteraceae bacterium]